MDEISSILSKYDKMELHQNLKNIKDLKVLSLTFFKDVAEIYDCITRIKNLERNPTGFSIDDAPILGLLTKTWKLLKEVIRYYEKNNAEFISIFERPIIEASITAQYLMKCTHEVILDYRKCSYKDRLRILRQLKEGSPFFETKAGKRLLKSVTEKMELEGFNAGDFQQQKSNKWRLQGKSFYDIFKEIEDEDLYHSTYGMMSESIHSSWNDSLDWCLRKQGDNSFSCNPFSYEADIRFVSPLIKFATPSYRQWLSRVEIDDEFLIGTLDWVEEMNFQFFMAFDSLYDGD